MLGRALHQGASTILCWRTCLPCLSWLPLTARVTPNQAQLSTVSKSILVPAQSQMHSHINPHSSSHVQGRM